MFQNPGYALLKRTGDPEHAWPSKVDMRGLKAGSSEILMQTIVFNYDRCHRLTR